jgi:hypothetical protein
MDYRESAFYGVLTLHKVNKRKLFLIFPLIATFVGIILTTTSFAVPATWYTGSNPPPGYLANPGGNAGGLEHMLVGAISTDLDVTTPGDYCNYYNTGAPLVHQNNLSGIASTTGFNPGTPYSDWQEGDSSSSNVCQAKGSTWGFKVSGASNNNCYPNIACGMHHFAKLSGGTSNRPWSSAYGTSPSPALTFSHNVTAQTANYTQGVFGYFCPTLMDVSTNNYIEYCFVEWQKGSGYPNISQFDQLGDCATTPSQKNVDIVFTAFGSNQTWSTQRAGSGNTFGNVPGSAYLTASITKENLLAAINRINSPAGPPNGCNRGLSTNLDNYALIGFEHGVEGGGFSNLGGNVSNENIKTTTDALFPGDTLQSGQTMYDNSGTVRLVMQLDGNLVIYNSANAAVWSSNTFGNNGARLVMQGDGNLVIYRTNNTAAWSSNTFGHTGAYATIQGDTNFVVYKGSQPKWSR